MTTTEHADQPAEAPVATTAKEGLVYPGMGLLFVVLICCFTAWGMAADLTTPMVAGFKQIFDMNTFQASLVQLAYFGAYFLLAIPAALINQRFGYKAGLLSGVLLAAAGAIAFYPASKIMTYEAFLVALFAIAAGCSILETSANPYVLSLGPEETATRRLNFAQAFNPVGTNIGVLLAATLILPKLDEPMNMANLTRHRSRPIRAGQLGAVMGPYLGLGFVLIAIGLVIAIKKSPPIVEEFPDADMEGQRPLKILLSNKRYVYGVIAQFFNVAAQVCTWTFLIQYSQQALNGSLELGGYLLQVSLIVFLISRFIMTWVIGKVRATKVLAGSRRAGGRAVRLRHVLAQRGRGGRGRRFVLLLVPDVPDDLRRRPSRARSGNEVRRGRSGDGHRRRRDHALDPGLPARRDQPGDLVHRSGRLLCRRRQFRRLRPEGDTPQGWRTSSMKRYWIITLAIVLAACGGGGQKANFSEADRPTRGRVVVGIALGTSGLRGTAQRVPGRQPRRGGRSTAPSPAAAAATSRSRSPRACGPVIPPTSGRRSWEARCAPGSMPVGSSTCPACTRARVWTAPCRRRCSRRRPTGSRRGACRRDHTAEMCCGSANGCCAKPASPHPDPATRWRRSRPISPKWTQAARRRCA